MNNTNPNAYAYKFQDGFVTYDDYRDLMEGFNIRESIIQDLDESHLPVSFPSSDIPYSEAFEQLDPIGFCEYCQEIEESVREDLEADIVTTLEEGDTMLEFYNRVIEIVPKD